MKKFIIFLALLGFVFAPTAPIFAAQANSTPKLTAQEQQLKRKLIQVRVKQRATKAKIKVNTLQAKAAIKRVKAKRKVIINKRTVVKAKIQALQKK